ncbi:isochorismatase family cysteine hydrolase [Radiobacillus sp. PE A8.2]|uniref:isochorismatase family cysteine hydrolase n=1 Tax=Radiobacillus sp. PE A8.2 TaxID=3380349 RepID=UPI00389009A9
MQIENTAVVFIDVINDFKFSAGDKLLHNTKQIAPNLIKLKQFAKTHHMPVIYVNDHYGMWQADKQKIFDYCYNPQNADFLEQIRPTDQDYFLTKPKLSAFYQTALSSLLRALKAQNIILAGIAGNICVLFTANDAHMRDFSISVPKNCIASNEIHENEQALQLMHVVLSANIEAI